MIGDYYITIATRRNHGEWQFFEQYDLDEFSFDEERFDDAIEAFLYFKSQTYENADCVMWSMVAAMIDPANWGEDFENTSDEDFKVVLWQAFESTDDRIENCPRVSIEYRGEILQHIFPDFYAYKKPVKRVPKQKMP